MSKRIIRREFNADLGESLGESLKHLPPILKRLYLSRSVLSLNEIEKEFRHLLPFQQLLGIDKATAILHQSILNQSKILIVGDFDADGATSTALAIRALKLFGAYHVDFLVPNRFAFGYGLTPELVYHAKKNKPDIIVTVDNGIANHAGVKAAKELGIKVIITDHHLPADTLPDADAIVNPNQPQDKFPSKNLAGVGVIFYLMLSLRRVLQDSNWFVEKNLSSPNMAKLLDLVALGTVADLVALDHNNRILVHHGILRIRSGQCSPGIIALLELGGRDFRKTVTSDLGFAVASRLNAAGRLDDMSLGIECLITDDPLIARRIARQLDQLNSERKLIEKDMRMQATGTLNTLQEKLKGQLPYGLCLFDENWHQGVIGILASRIKDQFNRPVIVFAPGQEPEIKGSARSIPGLHIRDVLAHIDASHPGLIKKFGGHAMAAGLTLDKKDFQTFERVFIQVISHFAKEIELANCLLSDGELEASLLNLTTAQLLREAEPWGQAFPEPLFDDVFQVVEQRLVGDKHLKLKLMKSTHLLDAIAFFVNTDVWPNHRCEHIRAAYRLDINEYKNRKELQLIIEYFEHHPEKLLT